jgi:hypothetical protein
MTFIHWLRLYFRGETALQIAGREGRVLWTGPVRFPEQGPPDMSIFTQVVQGKINASQAFTEVETWLGQVEHGIEQALSNDPAVQAAVNAFVADGKAAINVAADWAGTAIAGGLGSFSSELAVLIGKYAVQIAGASGGPLSAAAVTALQALTQVGVAAVQHEVAAIVASAGAPAKTTA